MCNGDTALYPLAKVKMKIDGILIEIEVAIPGTLLVSVLLRGDVLQLKQLISSSTGGNSLPLGSNDAMVVITRMYSRKQVEEGGSKNSCLGYSQSR